MDVPPAAMARDVDSGFVGWTAISDERPRREERSVSLEESDGDPQCEQRVCGGGRISRSAEKRANRTGPAVKRVGGERGAPDEGMGEREAVVRCGGVQ